MAPWGIRDILNVYRAEKTFQELFASLGYHLFGFMGCQFTANATHATAETANASNPINLRSPLAPPFLSGQAQNVVLIST
jgi:hypothetical protein